MSINNAKTAFVFPGQGSQALGMGKELSEEYSNASDVYQQIDDLLGSPLSKISWEGPEEDLPDTVNTQPALVAHSLAVLETIRSQFPNIRPKFVAGHSLGQISALVSANSLVLPSAINLVRDRGIFMKSAGQENPGGMGAILGIDIPTAQGICKKASADQESVQIANDNCPGQVVISGNSAALDRAIPLAKEAGARKAVRLDVSIAAHSSLMESAQKEFINSIENAGIGEPSIPTIGNVTAEPLETVDAIMAELSAQLTSRVRWTESIQYLISQGVNTFIEIGTGKVLSGLIKRIDRDSTRINLGTPADFESFSELV